MDETPVSSPSSKMIGFGYDADGNSIVEGGDFWKSLPRGLQESVQEGIQDGVQNRVPKICSPTKRNRNFWEPPRSRPDPERPLPLPSQRPKSSTPVYNVQRCEALPVIRHPVALVPPPGGSPGGRCWRGGGRGRGEVAGGERPGCGGGGVQGRGREW